MCFGSCVSKNRHLGIALSASTLSPLSLWLPTTIRIAAGYRSKLLLPRPLQLGDLLSVYDMSSPVNWSATAHPPEERVKSNGPVIRPLTPPSPESSNNGGRGSAFHTTLAAMTEWKVPAVTMGSWRGSQQCINSPCSRGLVGLSGGGVLHHCESGFFQAQGMVV